MNHSEERERILAYLKQVLEAPSDESIVRRGSPTWQGIDYAYHWILNHLDERIGPKALS